jgi:hypothetical protein
LSTDRGQFDSSKTRVAPVFNALQAGPDGWISKLLDLAADPSAPHPWRTQDLHVLETAWAPKERRLAPPAALLEWLVSNVTPPANLDREKQGKSRLQLLDRDEATIADALARIRRGETKRGWHILEGLSSPDAYIATKDALIIMEGKRTEAGPTTHTEWMSGRHQMLRHLDAAWEVRDGRSVYGLFIVEGRGNENLTEVPASWREAARATTSPAAIAASLPHRSSAEQRAIADCFVGITTWQAIVKEFGLSDEVLPDRVTPASESHPRSDSAGEDPAYPR